MDGTKRDTLKLTISTIEGKKFQNRFSYENSLTRVLRILEGTTEVKFLIGALRSDTEVASTLVERMMRIGTTQADFRYRNPNDFALATYLYVLAIASPRFVLVACRIALQVPNVWITTHLVKVVMSLWTSTQNLSEQVLHSEAQALEVHKLNDLILNDYSGREQSDPMQIASLTDASLMPLSVLPYEAFLQHATVSNVGNSFPTDVPPHVLLNNNAISSRQSQQDAEGLGQHEADTVSSLQ